MASGADFADRVRQGRARRGPGAAAGGRAFLTVRDADKVAVVPVARGARRARLRARRDRRHGAGARRGGHRRSTRRSRRATARRRARRAAAASISSSTRPQGRNARRDGYAIREAAVVARVPCITTLAGARGRRRCDRERAGRDAALAAGAARAEPGGVVRRRERLGRGVEAVGPYTLVRVTRGGARARRAGAVLHARGAGPRAAAADVALPRAARASSRSWSTRSGPGTRALAGARAGRRDRRLRAARQRLPAGRAPAAARRRRDRHRAAARTSPRRSSGRPPCSASAASTTPRRPRSSRTPRW